MIRPVEAADLKAIRQGAGPHVEDDDWKTSEALKKHFAEAKTHRDPMFLTKDEFFKIAHWKLISQYGRAKRFLEQNTAERIEHITAMAFGFTDPDEDLETTVHVSVLRLLPGVGMGVASAILALCYPDRYAPIDFRVWRQLFGTDLDMFELPEYRRNMARLRELVAELRDIDPEGGWTVQLVDYYCWERDKAA